MSITVIEESAHVVHIPVETILVDTDILIKHYRAVDKKSTRLFALAGRYQFAVSAITVFELTKGDSKPPERLFWQSFFAQVQILPFDKEAAELAAQDLLQLRKEGRELGNRFNDLFIAATAKRHNLRLATDNVKDFGRIPALSIVNQ